MTALGDTIGEAEGLMLGLAGKDTVGDDNGDMIGCTVNSPVSKALG